MTREKAIEVLKSECYVFNPLNFDRTTLINTALDMAIEALEQQTILDKIRAEMFEEMLSHSGTGEEVIQAYADGLKKGLVFIDKYKEVR